MNKDMPERKFTREESKRMTAPEKAFKKAASRLRGKMIPAMKIQK
jgi:hypothetical protein